MKTNRLNEPVVRLSNVTARVADFPVFEKTDWTIRKGEHWGVLGGTGSGKSMLVKILSRKIPIVSGSISYFFSSGGGAGRSYFKRGEVVTISPDAYNAFIRRYARYHQARWHSFEDADCPKAGDLLTGESIENRSPYQVDPPRIEAAIYEDRRQKAIRLLGIGHLLDRKVLHLSNGEGRKLLIARALMQAPRLFILDDPFSGLDKNSRESFHLFLNALLSNENGPTVIFASPRPEEIPDSITHLAVVADNKIVQKGPREGASAEVLVNSTARASGTKRCVYDFPSPLGSRDEVSGCGSYTPLISITDASVRYGRSMILEDVSWTVKPGENWAVLGPNGAGKTTLLGLVLGDNPQCYANNVRVMGMKRGTGETLRDIRANIGFLSPDLQTLHPPDDICMNVVLSGFTDSVGRHDSCSASQRKHAMNWMESLGIAELIHSPLGALSQGEQRLVLLARALVKDPSLLILDEPCQSLPADSREIILETLDRLCSLHWISLILVTHHPDEIPRAVSQVLHLSGGKIERVEYR